PLVGAECADLLAGPRVPHLNLPVRPPRDQVPAVGVERRGEELRGSRERTLELQVFPPGLRVPELDGEQTALRAGDGDPLTVGSPGYAEDDALLAWEPGDLLAGQRVPDPGGRAQPGRNHLPAVRADRQRPDLVTMVSKGRGLLLFLLPERGCIPDADRPILAGRREAPAVRAERQAPARAGVPAEAEHLPAHCRVPDVHGLVFAGRREAPAVRTERDAQDEFPLRQPVDEFA